MPGLGLGGRRLPEVRAALSTLGWEIRPVAPGGLGPDLARGPRPEVAWEPGGPPRGPRQGVGVLTVAADDAEQVLGVEVNLSYGIAYDDDHARELHFAQTAREVAGDVLGGPPTRLAGPGPRAVWIRPGADVRRPAGGHGRPRERRVWPRAGHDRRPRERRVWPRAGHVGLRAGSVASSSHQVQGGSNSSIESASSAGRSGQPVRCQCAMRQDSRLGHSGRAGSSSTGTQSGVPP